MNNLTITNRVAFTLFRNVTLLKESGISTSLYSAQILSRSSSFAVTSLNKWRQLKNDVVVPKVYRHNICGYDKNLPPLRLLSPFKLQNTNKSTNGNSRKDSKEDSADDLQAILHDKSIGIFAKFKILFQQYGVVLIIVHCITAAIWVAMFYVAISRGVDIVPLLEKYKVLDFIEKIPHMPSTEKIKNSGAKDWLLVYLIYEIAKPVRYIVTVFGTVFAVRYLRKLGYFKPAPKIDNQMREIMKAQRNIVQHRVKTTQTKYSKQYRNSRLGKLRQNYSSRINQMRYKAEDKTTVKKTYSNARNGNGQKKNSK